MRPTNRRRRRLDGFPWALLLCLVCCSPRRMALAAEVADTPPIEVASRAESAAPEPFQSTTQVVGTVALVGFVLLTAYLLSRRAVAARGDTPGLPSIRIVRRWPVARNAALLLIEVDGRFSLLGAGDQGLALIQSLPLSLPAAAPANARPTDAGAGVRNEAESGGHQFSDHGFAGGYASEGDKS